MNASPIGVVLAGGKSSRMGRDKALCEVGGLRLIDCVVARLTPQVARILISGGDDYGLRLETVADSPHGAGGPCAGIFSVARRLAGEADGFLTVPVDAPFLPEDLADRLVGAGSAVVGAGGALHPTFAWWRVADIEAASQRLANLADLSLRRLGEAIGARTVSWADDRYFLNINTRADLEAAQAELRRKTGG